MAKAGGLSGAIFRATEGQYLLAATDEQKNDYSGMSMKDKAKTLIGFLSAFPLTGEAKRARTLAIAMISRVGASGGSK
jgi:hypothetical protein